MEIWINRIVEPKGIPKLSRVKLNISEKMQFSNLQHIKEGIYQLRFFGGRNWKQVDNLKEKEIY